MSRNILLDFLEGKRNNLLDYFDGSETICLINLKEEKQFFLLFGRNNNNLFDYLEETDTHWLGWLEGNRKIFFGHFEPIKTICFEFFLKEHKQFVWLF